MYLCGFWWRGVCGLICICRTRVQECSGLATTCLVKVLLKHQRSNTGQRAPLQMRMDQWIWWATTRTIIAPGLLPESGDTFGHIQFLVKMSVTWASYHFWKMFRPKPEVLISFADFCSAVSIQCNARNNTIFLVYMDYFNSLQNSKTTLLNFHQLLPLTVLFQWTKYYYFLISFPTKSKYVDTPWSNITDMDIFKTCEFRRELESFMYVK